MSLSHPKFLDISVNPSASVLNYMITNMKTNVQEPRLFLKATPGASVDNGEVCNVGEHQRWDPYTLVEGYRVGLRVQEGFEPCYIHIRLVHRHIGLKPRL